MALKGELRKLEGRLEWIKCHPDFPEEYKGKHSWSVTLHPTKDSLEIIRDMQADGIKNIVKKGNEPGDYFVKFSQKTAKINKAGKTTETYTAPKVFNPDGSVFDQKKMLGSCEGYIEVDFYEHPIQGGDKSHAASLVSVHLSKVAFYGE